MTVIRRYARPELILGVIGVLASIWLLRDIGQLERPRAAVFPSALLWCLLVVSAVIGIQGMIGPLKAGSSTASGRLADLIVPTVILILGGVLVSLVGFYLTAPVLIFAFHAVHVHRSGQQMLSRQALSRGLGLAVAATAVMYLMFDVLIGLPTPSGTLL